MPPDIPEDLVPEIPGTALKMVGTVEGFYLGGAVVQFPLVGGGAIGVATNVRGKSLGDLVTVDCSVMEATREQIKVEFAGGGQEAEIDRFKAAMA